MSYPMNEFVTDLRESARTTDEPIPTRASLAGTAVTQAGDGIYAVMERGKDFYKAVGKRIGKEVGNANKVMHRNPYPTVLVGISAGALIGILVASRHNGKPA